MPLLSKSRPYPTPSSALRTWLPLSGALLMSLAVMPPAFSQSGKGGGTALAEAELTKRMQAQERAQTLVAEGDALAIQGKHCDAADRYRDAATALRPGAPATAALRADAVKKFAVSGVQCAKEQAANGAYEQARARLNAILAEDMAPNDRAATTLLKQLDDPDRFNPAMTPQHADSIRKVSKLLLRAEQFVELGQYDPAEAAYNQVLAVDPTNTSARRGLEQVQKHISEYHKSAKDETRLRMLNAVDRAWEPKVPSLAKFRPGDFASVAPGSGMETSLTGKLRTLILPRLSLSDASVMDAVSHLAKKSQELDPEGKGVNIVWNGNGGTAPREVNVDMKNVSLEEAIRAVADSAGARFRVEASVVILSMSAGSAMQTRTFRVPPGFLSTAASAAPTESSDPFATPDAGASKPKIGRLDARTYLENQGVKFPDGARAGYNPSANSLIVTNTQENLDIVESVVDALVTTTQRQVLVNVKLLKASQTNLREAGMDFFLDAFSIGGDKVFGSGGTIGNQSAGSSFQPLSVPFNMVNGPVTAGLRSTYELTRQRTIDDLIAISDGASNTTGTINRSPYIAGVGGLFTNPRFQALWRGLDQKKGIDLSVANSVVVKSGQRATAFSGRDFSYPTEFDPPQIPQTAVAPTADFFDPTTGQGFSVTGQLGQPPVTPATPSSFETKPIGSNIEVEAVVGEDGHTVDLNLAISFNEFDGFINYGTPITSTSSGTQAVLTDNRIIQPVFSKAAANAQVLVYDGQTVAVGGLMQHKTETIEDKVPVWGSLPLVGKLFKTKLTRDSRTAVIYFVTVHVIDPSGENVHSASPPADPLPAPAPSPEFDTDLIRADAGK